MQIPTTMPSILSEKIPTGLLRFKSGTQATTGAQATAGMQAATDTRAGKRALSIASFESAFDALSMHRVRSLFTMLGIIIGVAALIAVVTLTQGVNQAVNARFADLGANVVTITPGTTVYQGARSAMGSAQTLTLADAEALAQIPSIVNVSPLISVSEQVMYSNKNWNTKVNGVYPSYQAIQNWQTDEGTWFSEHDELTGAPVAVIGQTIATNLFSTGAQDAIGQTIRINNALFRVVGVLQTRGAQGAANADDVIFVPFNAARERLNSMLHIQQIQVQVASINDVGSVQQDISSLLRTRHALPGPDPALQQLNGPQQGSFLTNGGGGQQQTATSPATSQTDANPPDDFQVLSISKLVQSAQQSAAQMTILLIGIAAISLAVGGVGIMNIMLVSVTERTREIGIRIAVGARQRDIRNQFLLEAVILSTSGGIAGILIGLVAGLTLIWWLNLPLVLSPVPPLAAFGISACIGVASGIYPALNAARLDPIVAMRPE